MESIKALSVLDGRYSGIAGELAELFSEYGLIRFRVHVEIEWLKFVLNELKLAPVGPSFAEHVDAISKGFSQEDAMAVKAIEKTTNHDVKAVEYFIKDRLTSAGLDEIKEWVHFACTSDDINNLSYALMLKEAKELITGHLEIFAKALEGKAMAHKSVPMMSRTHGQPASPTTTGKEFVNFAWRIRREIDILSSAEVEAKINGATGNYNAHVFVFPEIDWIRASETFISGCLGLSPLLFTTQINPNASLAYILHALVRAAAITIDFDRDLWGYISLGYFKQQLKKGETGSSTMPHKVNPIDFENSEGNMGLAIAMMEHLAVKLQKSRFQRDLSDSTVLRSLGTAFGYFVIGIKNALKGLGKISIDQEAMAQDLEANPELLAEPFQTAMRVYEETNPYERLKELTRGRKIGEQELHEFVNKLEKVPPDVKKKMKELSPAKYVGLAEKLVDIYFQQQGA